jgi:hypothetical protein
MCTFSNTTQGAAQLTYKVTADTVCVELAHRTAAKKWSSSLACKLCLTTLCYTADTERSPVLGGDDYNRDFHSLRTVLPARPHRPASNNQQRSSLAKVVT